MDRGRRDAIKRLAGTGVVLAGASGLTALAWDRGGFGLATSKATPETRDFRLPDGDDELVLAVAEGDASTAHADLVTRAVGALGGMRRFISNGDVVVVKPNIGWDRTPAHAANTNPEVVAEVVRQAYDAGAKRVVVTDASCNDPHRCFQRSGIWRTAYEMGAEVIIPADHRFRQMRLRGELLSDWPVFTALVSCDKLINVPVAKHHNLSKYTGAMKNWYGSLGGRRNRLHQNIDVSIADLATFLQPTLTVIDATRVLMRNGPQGGNIADAKAMHMVIASTDQVAADGFGCTLLGRKPEEIAYLGMGEERGLGIADYKKVAHAFV